MSEFKIQTDIRIRYKLRTVFKDEYFFTNAGLGKYREEHGCISITTGGRIAGESFLLFDTEENMNLFRLKYL